MLLGDSPLSDLPLADLFVEEAAPETGSPGGSLGLMGVGISFAALTIVVQLLLNNLREIL